jgi:glycosyltransferase involved in cell wall biosynthesis
MRHHAVFIAGTSIGNSPSILNVLEFLLEAGSVHLFLKNTALRASRLLDDARLHLIDMDLLPPDRVRRQFEPLAANFSTVIAFDPQGFLLCEEILPGIQPFYYSLELYLEHDHSGLDYPEEIRRRERSAISGIRGLIIQSREREALFRRDYRLPDSIPAFILPVTYRGPSQSPHRRYLRERFRIPPDRRIALHLGGIAPWFSCIEIAEAMAGIPDWTLVFHGYPDRAYLQRLKDAIRLHRWSHVVVNEETFDDIGGLDDVLGSADAGIAWYNDISAGFRTAGHSSGKIAAYMRFGLPVVAKRYRSTHEAIEETDCGLCVDFPSQIPEALARIGERYAGLSENARRTYERRYRFEAYRSALEAFLAAPRRPGPQQAGAAAAAAHFGWDRLMAGRSAEEFLAAGDLWGENQGPDNPARQAFRDFLRREAARAPVRVLEIGFGSGIDYQAVESEGLLEGGRIEYYGADVTRKFVDHAERRFARMRPVLIDGYRLPFEDGFFDTVYLRHVLEHQRHYTELMREVFRTCRGEVFIVLFIPFTDAPEDRIDFDGTWYHNRYSRRRFDEFCAHHGFQLTEGPVFRHRDKTDAVVRCTRAAALPAPAADHSGRWELELDKRQLSRIVCDKLVPIVGVHPYPLDEQLFMTAAVRWMRPDIIVEWGTHIGASARIFFEAKTALGLEAEVHTIDLPPGAGHIENLSDPRLRARLIAGMPVVRHVGDGAERARGILSAGAYRRPLFFIDGDHTFRSVLRELEAVRSMAPQAAILVHDTHFRKLAPGTCCDPWIALEVFCRRHGLPRWFSSLGPPGIGLTFLAPPRASLMPADPPEAAAACAR